MKQEEEEAGGFMGNPPAACDGREFKLKKQFVLPPAC